MLSIDILLQNFQIQSITISPPFLIISPVISSIPVDLPFFNFLALHITSSLLMTSCPKYLFLAPSNPHTFTTTSSLLPMLCRFSKCSHHTLVTFISVSYTHLRAHETPEHLVCRLPLEKKNTS